VQEPDFPDWLTGRLKAVGQVPDRLILLVDAQLAAHAYDLLHRFSQRLLQRGFGFGLCEGRSSAALPSHAAVAGARYVRFQTDFVDAALAGSDAGDALASAIRALRERDIRSIIGCGDELAIHALLRANANRFAADYIAVPANAVDERQVGRETGPSWR